MKKELTSTEIVELMRRASCTKITEVSRVRGMNNIYIRLKEGQTLNESEIYYINVQELFNDINVAIHSDNLSFENEEVLWREEKKDE